jgi:uncharacterized protein (TIGR03437 family)
VSSSSSSQSFTANIAGINSPGNWLSVTPPSGTTPSAVSVSVMPTGLAPGAYMASILVAAAAGGSSQSIAVTLTVTSTVSLFPEIAAVVNAASFGNGGIAPGEIVTLGGTNFGALAPLGLTLDSNGFVATSLGGVSVSFNGYLAPLIYVSASQINCVVPYEIASISSPWVQVRNAVATSGLFQLTPAFATPAIFTADGSGSGPAAVTNGSGGANGPTSPAAEGSTVVIYVTGEGQTSPAGVTGQVTAVNGAGTGSITPQPVLPLSVTIGGQPAVVSFFGEAPDLVSGILQINVTVPQGLASGAAPIIVTLGNAGSQPGVTVYVSAN